MYREPSKPYSDSVWDKEKKQYEDLKILVDPTNPNIPSNFEFLYKDNDTGIVVYRINHK